MSVQRSSLDRLYAEHGRHVRRCLTRFGAAEADLDDLTQEVFLVVHAKQQLLDGVRDRDGWLHEIARRVAAAHRRRAHRRREVYAEAHEFSLTDATIPSGELERREQAARLHRALAKLDEESRDLIALHAGDLPLSNVAQLVEHDRKTVRKRLALALRRLEGLVGHVRPDEPSDPAPVSPRRWRLEPLVPGEPNPTLRVLLADPLLTVGLLGSVVIGVWPGPASVEALELLDRQFSRALETCDDGFAYLAVVEASTRPPARPGREKIVALLREYAPHIRIYATALHGGLSWIVKPVMTGLSFLARPPFPMEFFTGTAPAAAWLCAHYPVPAPIEATRLTAAAEQLRALSPAQQAGAPGEPAGSSG